MLLFILAGVVAAFISILQVWDSKGNKKKITAKAAAIIILTIVAFGLTLGIFLVTEDEELEYKKGVAVADSVHRQQIIDLQNENYRKLDSSANTTIEALAVYGLKYDTAQKRIEKLVKDSANNKVQIINSPDPLFAVEDIQIERKLDTVWMKIAFTSFDASSYDLNVTLSSVSKDNSNRLHLLAKGFNPFSSNQNLPKDGIYLVNLFHVDDSPYPSEYFTLVTGTIKKSDGTIIPIDQMYSKTHVAGFGNPYPAVERRIRNFIASVNE